MRRETPFTLEEAKAYVTESITEWDTNNQTDKIISLASYAYNRRTKKSSTTSDKDKIIEIEKNIKSLETIIKRNKRSGITFDVYEKDIEKLKTWCEKTRATLSPEVDEKT